MNRQRLTLSAGLAGALALAGCSGGGQTFLGSNIGAPTVSTNVSTVAFGTVPLGQTSAIQNVTVTNTGGGAGLALTAVKTGGIGAAAFLSTSACPASLARGASCTVSVAYSPTASGIQTAELEVVDNAENSPQLVALSGTGSSSGPVVSLSATALTFTRLPVGQAATQTVTVTNIGSYPLNLAGFALGGANASSFSLAGSCLTTASVASAGSCFLIVTYAPTTAGQVSAIVNVNSNSPNSPQTVALSST